MITTTKKYDVIYADPPWSWSSGLKAGNHQYKPDTTSGEGQYLETLSSDEIKDFKVNELAADDCILFIWTTDAHLQLALEVIAAWGFKYKTIGFIWNKKEKSGKQVCYYGSWTMKGSEICLLATKGRAHKLLKSRKVRQLVEAVRNRKIHSQKPDEIRLRIDALVGDVNKIELFARTSAPGWDAWGDEV